MPIEIKMPRLSDTMEQGTIVKWSVKPGQKVSAGDVIADIETDKATMELQTFEEGTVGELVVAEGQQVPVGTVIATLAGDSEPAQSARPSAPAGQPAAAKSSQAESPKGPPAATPLAQSAEQRVQDRRHAEAHAASNGRQPAQQHGGERIFASPLARKIADESGIDLGAIQGTGPSGRIIRKDVEAALVSQPEVARHSVPGAGSREPAKISGLSAGAVPGVAVPPAAPMLAARKVALSNMRGTIAKRLVQSKATIPHYQVTVTARMDALLALRAQLNDQLASQGVKLSVNDFLVRACALAMHQHPFINARWNDGPQPSIDIVADVNIGVAIALPVNPETLAGGGLVVATLRNADRMGLRQISADTKRLSDKARAKGLSIEEMSDSTFTISNLGMFGVEHFTAIINPPNAAILAVGAAVEKPVVGKDPKTGEKKLAIGTEMQMTMSSDHRIIDGAMAAAYLATVKDLLEKPATLLV